MSRRKKRSQSNEGPKALVCYSVAVAIACAVSAGCGPLERGKQIRAHAQLQYLSALVEAHTSKGRPLPTPEDLRERAGTTRFMDPWGGNILYRRLQGPSGSHYILACLGSDHKLDVERLTDYIGAASEHVGGDASRDIVVVDGRFVRNAGK